LLAVPFVPLSLSIRLTTIAVRLVLRGFNARSGALLGFAWSFPVQLLFMVVLTLNV